MYNIYRARRVLEDIRARKKLPSIACECTTLDPGTW